MLGVTVSCEDASIYFCGSTTSIAWPRMQWCLYFMWTSPLTNILTVLQRSMYRQSPTFFVLALRHPTFWWCDANTYVKKYVSVDGALHEKYWVTTAWTDAILIKVDGSKQSGFQMWTLVFPFCHYVIGTATVFVGVIDHGLTKNIVTREALIIQSW